MIQIQKNRTKKESPCGQGGRRKYARSGYINNSSVTSNYGGGVLHATLTPPSLALLAPPSCSQDSTWRAVRACSQNAPVLPLNQHLLLAHKTAPFGLFALDHKTHLLDSKMHLRAWSRTGLGASGGNAPLRAGEILKALRLEIAIWLAQERMPRAF